MKLKWSHEQNRWLAEGGSYSYMVVQEPASPYPFRVMQMRQHQIVNCNGFVNLSGAQARAQVWEDA